MSTARKKGWDFNTIIYEQRDQDNPACSLWVRMHQNEDGISVDLFTEEPTENTLVSVSIASMIIDVCHHNEASVQIWSKGMDPTSDGAHLISLIPHIHPERNEA